MTRHVTTAEKLVGIIPRPLIRMIPRPLRRWLEGVLFRFDKAGSGARKRIRDFPTKHYFQTTNDYRNTVLLAGVGRSGTTWVEDIINYRNEYRMLFEPFHGGVKDRVPALRSFRFEQYIRSDNRDERFLAPARAILSGRIRDPWIDQFNRRFVCRRRLTKVIRANLFLKWISVNFPEIPIVLLFRHPCPVASSRLELGWWESEISVDEYLAQDDLVADFLHPFVKQIGEFNTAFDKEVLLWCIQNYVPLKQFHRGEIHLVFYENLCVSPEDEIKSMFSFLGQQMDDRVLAVARRPSIEVRKDSAIITGESLIGNWRRKVSPEQIARANEILAIFGMDKIYSAADSMPNAEAALAMMLP